MYTEATGTYMTITHQSNRSPCIKERPPELSFYIFTPFVYFLLLVFIIICFVFCLLVVFFFFFFGGGGGVIV